MISEKQIKMIAYGILSAILIAIFSFGATFYSIVQQDIAEQETYKQKVSELENKSKVYDYYIEVLVNQTINHNLFNNQVITWHDEVEKRLVKLEQNNLK